MATILFWFKLNKEYLGNCEAKNQQIRLSKISEIIANVKVIWSKLDQGNNRKCNSNKIIILNKWIESERD